MHDEQQHDAFDLADRVLALLSHIIDPVLYQKDVRIVENLGRRFEADLVFSYVLASAFAASHSNPPPKLSTCQNYTNNGIIFLGSLASSRSMGAAARLDDLRRNRRVGRVPPIHMAFRADCPKIGSDA
jgi:hypothetical protein